MLERHLEVADVVNEKCRKVELPEVVDAVDFREEHAVPPLETASHGLADRWRDSQPAGKVASVLDDRRRSRDEGDPLESNAAPERHAKRGRPERVPDGCREGSVRCADCLKRPYKIGKRNRRAAAFA